MIDRQQATASIEQVLHDYCFLQIQTATTIGSGYTSLWTEIDHYLAGGGKRIRPYLVLLSAEAYGHQKLTDLLQVAAAWELLHAALLVHDDIIDRDTTRHGILNIAGQYKRKYDAISEIETDHYSLSAALLAGDLLIYATNDIVANASGLNSDQKLLAQSLLQSALYSVGGGELLDMESVLYPIEQSDPLAVNHYKTATYSFQLPLRSGAALAGAPESELRKLDEIGLAIGAAFQLRDDILGVYGSEESTGKSNRSDIYEKKRTLLMQVALQRLEQTKADRLEALLSINTIVNDAEADEIILLLDESGAHEVVNIHIDKYKQDALEQIDKLEISPDYKAVLVALAEKAAGRNS